MDIKKYLHVIIICIIISLIFIYQLIVNKFISNVDLFGGGIIHISKTLLTSDFDNLQENYTERYQRPSKASVLENKYRHLKFFQGNPVPSTFYNPEDLILAYYGLVEEASNMIGYSGGCGSVGNGNLPYPYAYDLFTNRTKKKMSLQQFEDSFKGIGHISLLTLIPMSKDISSKTEYYVVEIETIEGDKIKGTVTDYNQTKTVFAYYYGIITVIKENQSWKIDSINYFPEEFLCAPYHSWFYDAKQVIQIVYMENLKIIDKIIYYEQKGNLITIDAMGNGKKYQLVFVRLTNGHDILLNEYQYINNKLVATDLLTEEWKSLKLSNNFK